MKKNADKIIVGTADANSANMTSTAVGTMFCGDFNNHVPELGSASNDGINIVREFTQRGFICHNNTYCYGEPTHKRDGVLDLLFEYPPTDNEPFFIEAMRICAAEKLVPLF